MTHPNDDLSAYLAGDLDAAERRRIEAHLETCVDCRRELERLDEAYVALVESLPAEDPPARVWEQIERRVAATSPDRKPLEAEPDRTPLAAQPARAPAGSGFWTALALAASLVVASVGVLWGLNQQQAYESLRAEHVEITRFLAQDGVTARALPIDEFQHGGTVLFGSGGRALVVMRNPPPAQQSYQAWGIAGDQVTSLGVIDARTLEVQAEAYDQIAVSLEPEGGSPSPTNVLGGVPTS